MQVQKSCEPSPIWSRGEGYAASARSSAAAWSARPKPWSDVFFTGIYTPRPVRIPWHPRFFCVSITFDL